MNFSPHNYQSYAIDYIETHPVAAILLDMGLGKTVETIRFLQERKARNALIVCPKIIRYQWQNQLKKWAGFEAEIYERQSYIPDDGRMWIVNYDKLRNEKTMLKFRSF